MGAGPGWAVFERAACPTDEGSRDARRHEITRNRKMSNRVVLITGALTGIGRASAQNISSEEE
jgi:hypothetical protein